MKQFSLSLQYESVIACEEMHPDLLLGLEIRHFFPNRAASCHILVYRAIKWW